MQKMNIAIVGCGNISSIYLENLTTRFDHVQVYAVSDLKAENAQRAAQTYHIPHIMTLEDILADENVDIILNLTTPHGHYDICRRALEAGKHVYVEKPLSLTYKKGKELLSLAEEKGLCLGCAPDTFMGAGIATCAQLIRQGVIGDVIGATAFLVNHGHEHWHPAPAFYYQLGGGPMLDMGPYYLTALTEMLGNAASVMGMASTGNPTRTVTSQPRQGEVIPVEVPTHVNGLIRFENGAIGNIITSFDVWGSRLPLLEVHGTKGSLLCPDPNFFGGDVMCKVGNGEFETIPYVNAHSENLRGMGIADMARAIQDGSHAFAANGKRALHVLEIMEKIHQSSEQNTVLPIETRF